MCLVLAIPAASAADLEPGTARVQMAEDAGHWVVDVARSCADRAVTARVSFIQTMAPSTTDPPHVGAGAAQAFHTAGEQALEAGSAEAAFQCAEQGIEALGGDYAGAGVVDDTWLKISLAKGRFEDGEVKDAAAMMLKMLEERVAMYAARYGVDVSTT